ncbi:MAG: hypothetical protein JNK38_25860 [Acidobacteria bacterium]|nr:hypothetical protein [Acidobacteriota bacterium]
MVIEQIIPTLRELNRADKWRLIQVLVTDLAEEESGLSLQPGEYPVWTPLESYGAAERLMMALEEARQERAKGRAI